MKFCGVCGYDGKEGSEETNLEYITAHPVITFRKANPIASEMWNFDNNDIYKNPDSLNYKSNYVATFRCENGHSFRKALLYMFDTSGNPKGCPYCEEKIAASGKNDFFSVCPEAKDMWDFESNWDIDPTRELSTSQKTAFFKCSHEHIRHTSLLSFTKSPGCLECKKTVGGRDDLIKFWDYEKNEDDPWYVYTTEKERLRHWKCKDCSYEWEQTVYNRAVLKGKCANCGVQKKSMATEKSLLPFSEYHPEAAKLWIKADKPNITPENLIHWICNEGHEFEHYINLFSRAGRFFCPICENRVLKKGENDLLSQYPELAAEFDSEKNGITPDMIRVNDSNVKTWWKCIEKGHSFQRDVSHRIKRYRECPVCTGSIIIPGVNTMDVTNPELAKEWSLNNEKPASEVFKNKRINAHWICPTCGGDYTAIMSERFAGDDSCPYCNKGRPLAGVNTLDITDPGLALEWSTVNDRSVDTVTKDMRISAIWTCPKCHGDYSYPIVSRQLGDDSCPYCNGRKVLKGYNSLAKRHPNILCEWDYISNYLIADPDEILESYPKTVWWKCKECGRKYELSPKAKLLFEKRHMKSCKYCKGNRRKMHHFF